MKISSIRESLSTRVIGQDESIDAIVPFLSIYLSGLAPEDRPIGNLLLLGPTGTGKTRTVEALAEVLHGNKKNILRIDCGEFQMEHEVAKLIGAPPGYLGHRETQAAFTQVKLNAVMSDRNNISIVLFDEIEKASSAMVKLLLGILDNASLRLGDNSTVSFARSLIFMTSNVGSKELASAAGPGFGLDRHIPKNVTDKKLNAVGLSAVKRRFPVEFVNRIDKIITYKTLSEASTRQILEIHLDQLQTLIDRRSGEASFQLVFSDDAFEFLLKAGISAEFGARELRRVIQLHIMQPVALALVNGLIQPDCEVLFLVDPPGEKLSMVVNQDA